MVIKHRPFMQSLAMIKSIIKWIFLIGCTVILLFVGLVLARVYWLHWGGVESDDASGNLPQNQDNAYYIPGYPVNYSVKAYLYSDTTSALEMCFKPYLCKTMRCYESWLATPETKRRWNEYRITNIVYDPLRNGSLLMPSLSKQQTITRIEYFDEKKQIIPMRELSGIIDDPQFIFIHPPRGGVFDILELCPMPSINLPLTPDSIYLSHLSIPASMVPDSYKARYPGGLTMTNEAQVFASYGDADYPYVNDLSLIHMSAKSPDDSIHTGTDILYSAKLGPLKFQYDGPFYRIVLRREIASLPYQ